MRSLVLLGLLALFSGSLAFRKQKYHIKGKFVCGDEPAAGVRIRLMEHDTGLDPDDELDDGRTNSQGMINLQGDTRELSTIDPYAEIYHDCLDINQKTGIRKPCQRKWTITLPDAYINKGPFDFGVVNLEMKLKDEDRDCIN